MPSPGDMFRLRFTHVVFGVLQSLAAHQYYGDAPSRLEPCLNMT